MDLAVKIELRWRVLAFIVALMLDAIFIRVQPWSLIVGCVAYLVIVYPALMKSK